MFVKHITLKSTKGSLSRYGHLSRKPRYGHLIKCLIYEKPSTQPHILEKLLRLAFNPLMEQMNTIISGHDSFFTLMEDIVTVKYRPDQFDKLTAIPHLRYHSSVYDSLLIKFKVSYCVLSSGSMDQAIGTYCIFSTIWTPSNA